MIKKSIVLMACFFSFVCFSMASNSMPNFLSWFIPNLYAADPDCGQALPTNDPGFCASFKNVAACHCSAKLPAGMCQSMTFIYTSMIGTFHSVEAACAWQAKQPNNTSEKTCRDDWNCYRSGGKDSQGRLCSATGNACA